MRAFNIEPKARIFAYSEPVSMVGGFPALMKLSEKYLGTSESGDLFLFMNKKANYLKVLFYAEQGWCMFAKKLPLGMFERVDNNAELSLRDLHEVVNNVVIPTLKKKKKGLLKAA